ncbi:uncharacterized protein TRUGW13939_06416 [Talaromyces rugulosus]|uniref:Uncharacterized protein n=1 Tax=Talaromyces rugulosus TaxID=121627 RepID=A0A7H8QYS7_TALRU|nr:uncharacterized protein TRUGW13939_06416 [Talaromyces rugulosus]QKX59284.1 hypothetical protein TRUGW13939_06416 [Talaromyces rugulosus]
MGGQSKKSRSKKEKEQKKQEQKEPTLPAVPAEPTQSYQPYRPAELYEPDEPRDPNEPQLGSFKIFWDTFKTLRDQTQDKNPDFVASREKTFAEMYMLYDPEHGTSHLLDIGAKIDMLLSSKIYQDIHLAANILTALDMRCSIRSHPNWKRVKDPDQAIRHIRGSTTTVLYWFCKELTLTYGYWMCGSSLSGNSSKCLLGEL